MKMDSVDSVILLLNRHTGPLLDREDFECRGSAGAGGASGSALSHVLRLSCPTLDI